MSQHRHPGMRVRQTVRRSVSRRERVLRACPSGASLHIKIHSGRIMSDYTCLHSTHVHLLSSCGIVRTTSMSSCLGLLPASFVMADKSPVLPALWAASMIPPMSCSQTPHISAMLQENILQIKALMVHRPERRFIPVRQRKIRAQIVQRFPSILHLPLHERYKRRWHKSWIARGVKPC